jgi:hypothetical protein
MDKEEKSGRLKDHTLVRSRLGVTSIFSWEASSYFTMLAKKTLLSVVISSKAVDSFHFIESPYVLCSIGRY